MEFIEQNKMQFGISILIYHTELAWHGIAWRKSTVSLSIFPTACIDKAEKLARVQKDSEPNNGSVLLLAS